MMELARVITAKPLAFEVRLIAFGAEEIGLRGSIEAAKTINSQKGRCLGWHPRSIPDARTSRHHPYPS